MKQPETRNEPPRDVWFDAIRDVAGATRPQSGERWRNRRQSGLTDAELLEAIGQEFGIQGGSSCVRKYHSAVDLVEWDDTENSRWPYGYAYHGGTNPRLAVTEDFCRAHMSEGLKAAELVVLAREALEIPDAGGAFQQSLF